MGNLFYHIKLSKDFIKNTLARDVDYRANFICDLVDSLANFSVSIIFFNVIYGNTFSISGWEKYQTLLLLGTTQFIIGILYTLFMNNLPRIQKYVLKGDLDYILLYPCDNQFYISLRYFYFGGLGNSFLALMLIIYALNNLKLNLSVSIVIIFIIYLAAGIIIAYSLWFIVMTCSIYFIKVSSLHEFFISTLKFMEFPRNIYKGFMNIIISYIFPIALVTNIPVGFIIGKITFQKSLFIILIAILFFIISRVFWKYSLRRYQSASS